MQLEASIQRESFSQFLIRYPGKYLSKQQSVKCDDLIHEFEILTTDQDGLLGVLEDTLHEYGSEANFEAKKLLCALFQVLIE